jgi:arabinogalactan endo-1,4-beta-galactosidase
MKHILSFLLPLTLVLTACNKPDPVNPPDPPKPQPEDSSKFVFPTDRWVGGDISLLPSYEAVNTPYKDANGNVIPNVLTYVHDSAHWNAIRVRLFVDPVIINPDNGKRQGEVQDLDYVKGLGKRIKDADMTFMLDFHYSDTWADPVKQTIPNAWKDIEQGQPMADKVYAYTKQCLTELVAAGATPDFIQVGNEISYGMLWANKGRDMVGPNSPYEDYQANWEKLSLYLNAGARACREVCPAAKIVIHIERTTSSTQCVNYFKYIGRNNVDYDIIGLSYYPFWHGYLDKLSSTLIALKNNFPDKPVQIVETAYYNAYFPTDGSATYKTTDKWGASEKGQNAYLKALCEELKKHDNVNGLYYWFPEENGNGGASYDANKVVIDDWLNRGLWDPSKHKAFMGLMALQEFYLDKE